MTADRWEASLALIARSVRPVLGPWLPRLGAQLGPVAARPRAAERGESDGVDGIGRRGSWERLVASSWALADEAPDEFLRRAAAGEHLFLRTARREPSQSPRVVVWFDAGPDQLGVPRVAHLALWLVLAERVTSRGGVLRWGALQAPEDGWSEGTGAQDGRRLLAARTLAVPTREHVAAWAAADEGPGPVDERWVVGGRRAAALARELGARAIRVDEPDEDALRVHVEGGPTVTLPLPGRAQLGGMLHDPFVRRRTARSEPRSDGIHAFPDPWGNAPITRIGDRIVRWAPPWQRLWRRPRATRRLELRDGWQAVAVGWFGRRLFAVATEGERLRTIGLDDPVFGRAPKPLPAGFAGPAAGAPGVAHVVARPGRSPDGRVLVQDGAGVLWVVDLVIGRSERLHALTGRPWVLDQTRDLVFHADGASPAVVSAAHRPLRTGLLNDHALHTFLPWHGVEGRAMRPAYPNNVAVDCGDHWRIGSCRMPVRQRVPPMPGSRVLGALTRPDTALVALAPDRQTLQVRGDVDADLRPTAATILDAWLSPTAPVVYWRDAAGQVGCVGVPDGRVWLTWTP